MNTFKKLLIASTMVVTIGATTSCGNNAKSINTGLPYTLVIADDIPAPEDGGQTVELGFDCKGSGMKVYWSDDIEKASSEKSHKFEPKEDSPYAPYFIVEGKITSIWFCDESGNSLYAGNETIIAVAFSNTITSLPKQACASMLELGLVYIPGSVKKIGEYAITPNPSGACVCEAGTRPSGWSPNWYYGPILGNYVVWGVSCYIPNNGPSYLLYNMDGVRSAAYFGYLMPLKQPVTKITIPKSIEINKKKFPVLFVLGSGYEFETLKEVEINNTVNYISDDAFEDCNILKDIKFIGDFEYLSCSSYVFSYLDSLETIALPNGLMELSYSIFEGCPKLKKVTIPETVQYIKDDTFYNSCGESKELTIYLKYKTASNIPQCDDEEMFGHCKAEKVKFVHESSVEIKDFVAKGWPDSKTGDEGKITVTWEQATA